jgi:outer membrane protein
LRGIERGFPMLLGLGTEVEESPAATEDIVRQTSIVSGLIAGVVIAVAAPALAEDDAARLAAVKAASTFDDLIDAELAGGGLTSNEVARRSNATSPSVRVRSEELRAAEAEVDAATAAYLPTTKLVARYTRLSDTRGDAIPGLPISFEQPLNQYNLEASVTVPVSDYFLRVAPSRTAAKFGQTAAAKNLEATQSSSDADARLLYYAWVEARLRVIVAEQALAQSTAHLADAKAQFAAGAASQADVMRIESQVAKSELLVTQTRHLRDLNEERLRTSMHAAGSESYRIGEDIRKPLDSRTETSFSALWAEAVRTRPELAALKASQSAQEKSAQVERAAYAPRVDVFGNAQYARPNSRVFPVADEFRGSWDAGVQLTWTISDIPGTSAKARAADARARATQAERDEAIDAIRVEVMAGRQQVEEARVAESTTLRGLIAAEESYRARHLLYQNGRATTVELLDAETDLTGARLDAIDARIDARVAEVRLARAVGINLSGSRGRKNP